MGTLEQVFLIIAALVIVVTAVISGVLYYKTNNKKNVKDFALIGFSLLVIVGILYIALKVLSL